MHTRCWGTDEKAGASDTKRGPWFKSNHGHTTTFVIVNCMEKTNKKKKRPIISHIIWKTSFYLLRYLLYGASFRTKFLSVSSCLIQIPPLLYFAYLWWEREREREREMRMFVRERKKKKYFIWRKHPSVRPSDTM